MNNKTPKMPHRGTKAAYFMGVKGERRQGIAENIGPSLASGTKGTSRAPVGGPQYQRPVTRKVNTILRKMGMPRGGGGK